MRHHGKHGDNINKKNNQKKTTNLIQSTVSKPDPVWATINFEFQWLGKCWRTRAPTYAVMKLHGNCQFRFCSIFVFYFSWSSQIWVYWVFSPVYVTSEIYFELFLLSRKLFFYYVFTIQWSNCIYDSVSLNIRVSNAQLMRCDERPHRAIDERRECLGIRWYSRSTVNRSLFCS